MIRKFNYTGRKRIPRSQVAITLVSHDNGPRSFQANLNLNELELTPDATIFIEAYHRTQCMRFEFGTVGHVKPPADRYLADIDVNSVVHFRVKVVDTSKGNGLMLAVADEISPLEQQEKISGKKPLLPVDVVDLGETVWRVSFEDDKPVLQVNNKIDDIREIVRSDYNFLSLVFPAVFREVLYHMFIDLEEDLEEDLTDTDGWCKDWKQFVRHLPDIGELPRSREERQQWIKEVVDAFCSHYRTRRRFVQGRKMENPDEPAGKNAD